MSIALVVKRLSPEGVPCNDTAHTLTFDQPRIVLGRGAHADLRLPSRGVSCTHAVLSLTAGEISITDEHSTNGTIVNNTTLVHGRRKVLKHGDRIVVPHYEISLETSTLPADPREHSTAVARSLLKDMLAVMGSDHEPPEIMLLTGRRAGRRWVFADENSSLRMGRSEPSEILLEEHLAARVHAEIAREGNVAVLRVLAPQGELLVNGRPIPHERKLRHGDEIQFGRTALRFIDPAEELLRTFDSGHDERSALRVPPVVATPAIESPVPEASTESASPARPITPGLATDDLIDNIEAEVHDRLTVRLEPSRKKPARKGPPGSDWVVLTLAVVILLVSVTALIVLLRGMPTTRVATTLRVISAPSSA